MRSWLVTGGAGFIGSHLVDALLAAGDQVCVLDDLSTGRRHQLARAAEFLHGSVTDAALVRQALRGCDGAFHLAAIASVARCVEDWAGTHAINQTGTVTVLEAARQHGGLPVVYASSAAVYGDLARERLAETDPTAPLSADGCDKLGSELHARIARTSFATPTLGLRLFNVYGPRQDGASPYSGVISSFRHRLQRNQPLVLNGGGRQTRDFVHVADVVQAMCVGMGRLPDTPPVINVCSGRSIAVYELAGMLGAITGTRPRLLHGPDKVGDILHSRGDPTLLAASLAVRCQVDLRAGLASMHAAETGAGGRKTA